MKRLGRRAMLGTVGAGMAGISGCLGLLSETTGDPAKITIVDDKVSFEPNGTTLSGQLHATDPSTNTFSDGDSFDPDTGSFTVSGTDTDAIGFAEGTLRSFAFTVDGDGAANVFRNGELLESRTSEFSRTFDTPTPTFSPTASPTPTPEPTTVIDDFERDRLTEYTLVPPGKSWTIATNHVASGSRNLYTNDDHYYSAISLPGDGLPNYPSAGDTFSGVVGYAGADAVGVYFGVQATTTASDGSVADGYRVGVSPYNQAVRLDRVENGETTRLDTTPLELPSKATFTVTVEWAESGAITATVASKDGDERATLSGTDTTFSDGGFGFRAGDYKAPVEAWFDDWQLDP